MGIFEKKSHDEEITFAMIIILISLFFLPGWESDT